MKLTAKTIDTIQLPAGRSELVVFDDEVAGFFVRVRAGGSRTLGYQYRIGGKNRRLTLGTAVKEAFPNIRQQVLALQAQVRLGTDPAAVKQAAVEALSRQDAESFKAIADLYLTKRFKASRASTHKEEKRYLLDKAKSLHKMPVSSITKKDIAKVANEAEAAVSKGKGGASTANRVLAFLSACFSWAMREGLCESNPVIGTNKRNQPARNRTLVKVDPETLDTDMSELVRVWKALPDNAFGDVMRLLILTGQRRQEIGGLQWRELNEDMTRITLPPERQKNDGGKQRLEFFIPLSQPARDILTRQQRIVGWECVFSDSSHGLGNWGGWKRQLDEKLPGMPAWTIHDIRRSVVTGMAGIGIQPHIREAVVNHISGFKGGVSGVYDKYPYEKEKRQALTLWAEHLMGAISGTSATVVPLLLKVGTTA